MDARVWFGTYHHAYIYLSYTNAFADFFTSQNYKSIYDKYMKDPDPNTFYILLGLWMDGYESTQFADKSSSVVEATVCKIALLYYIDNVILWWTSSRTNNKTLNAPKLKQFNNFGFEVNLYRGMSRFFFLHDWLYPLNVYIFRYWISIRAFVQRKNTL